MYLQVSHHHLDNRGSGETKIILETGKQSGPHYPHTEVALRPLSQMVIDKLERAKTYSFRTLGFRAAKDSMLLSTQT